MKAVYVIAFNKALQNLRVEEVAEPRISAGEVKVKVLASSVNPSDVKNVQGKMAGTTLPRIPGRDFAGIVVEGPPGLVGTEVWGTGGDVGFTRDGSHAEYIAIPTEAVTPKPRNLSFEQAACVGVNFVTAYQGLIRCAKLRPGETVLVTGGGCGVGLAVLQLAETLDAKLIAADRKPFSPETFESSKLLGFVDVSKASLQDAVRDLTKGVGVDVVYDCVGGELLEPVLSSLRQLGRHVAITSVGPRRVSFDLLDFYHRRLTLYGVDSRALTVTDCAKLLASISPQFQSGRLKPSTISRRGGLAEAYDLYSFVDKGGTGKVVFAETGAL